MHSNALLSSLLSSSLLLLLLLLLMWLHFDCCMQMDDILRQCLFSCLLSVLLVDVHCVTVCWLPYENYKRLHYLLAEFASPRHTLMICGIFKCLYYYLGSIAMKMSVKIFMHFEFVVSESPYVVWVCVFHLFRGVGGGVKRVESESLDGSVNYYYRIKCQCVFADILNNET